MSNLPNVAETIMRTEASEEAKETLHNILERKQVLEDYVAIVQPLLFCLSKVLYAEDDREIPLSKLIEDGIKHINGDVVTVEAKELV